MTPLETLVEVVRDLSGQTALLREAQFETARALAILTEAKKGEPLYKAGDKAAAAACQISVPTFQNFMKEHGIKPRRAGATKLWLVADLKAIPGDDTPFPQRNTAIAAARAAREAEAHAKAQAAKAKENAPFDFAAAQARREARAKAAKTLSAERRGKTSPKPTATTTTKPTTTPHTKPNH
jgi:hypothetical protein